MAEQNYFGTYLRLLRSARGLTQKEVATRLPCSQSHISLLETGSRRPLSRSDIRRLCSALDLDAETSHSLYESAGFIPVGVNTDIGIGRLHLGLPEDEPIRALRTRLVRELLIPRRDLRLILGDLLARVQSWNTYEDALTRLNLADDHAVRYLCTRIVEDDLSSLLLVRVRRLLGALTTREPDLVEELTGVSD